MIIGKYSTVSVAQWCIRALASFQCGLHWNPVVDAICWVCCWFSPLLQDIFLWVLQCASVLKNQHFQIPIQPGIRYLYVKNHYVDVLPLNRYLFIIPYIILITTIFVEDNTIIVLLLLFLHVLYMYAQQASGVSCMKSYCLSWKMCLKILNLTVSWLLWLTKITIGQSNYVEWKVAHE